MFVVKENIIRNEDIIAIDGELIVFIAASGDALYGATERETGEVIADLATATNIYIFDGAWRPQQEIIEVMPAGMKTVIADFKNLSNVYIFDGIWDRESEVVRV